MVGDGENDFDDKEGEESEGYNIVEDMMNIDKNAMMGATFACCAKIKFNCQHCKIKLH